MKKLLILLLLGLIVLDTDAEVFSGLVSGKTVPGGTSMEEMNFIKKKKRKSHRGKGGRGRRGKSIIFGAGPGFVMGLPLGDFAASLKPGMGFSLEADYFPTPQFSAGLRFAYMGFKYDEAKLFGNTAAILNKGSFTVMPVEIQGKYYLSEEPVKPYLGLGIGMFSDAMDYDYDWKSPYLNELTQTIETVNINNKVVHQTTDFGLAPSLGLLVEVTEFMAIHANARYEMFFYKHPVTGNSGNNAFLGIQAGLNIQF